MHKTSNIDLQLEILISTMNRTSLDFLKPMFINSSAEHYQILIINQTTEDAILESDKGNIRVVNSFETGLPQSRNLAIKHALGDVCLIADDDVVYSSSFRNSILNAHVEHASADIITFKMTDEDGNLYRNYPHISKHNKDSIRTANSVVISFKRENLLKS